MSLLNDVLKDINKRKESFTTTPVFQHYQKPSFFQRFSDISPWIIAPFLTASVILGSIYAMGAKHEAPQISVAESLPASTMAVGAITSLESTVPSIWIKEAIVEHQISAVPSLAMTGLKAVDSERPVERPGESESGHVDKVLVPLSDTEWYDEQLNQALLAIQDNRDDDAELLLSKLLTRFPKAIVARETLANLYLAQERFDSARQTVDAGLSISPNAVSLNMIKARLLFEEKHPKAALSLLRQFSPGISKYPDYYGLMAAIMEALGQHQEAGALYKILVKVDQGNPQYWLGFGLTLEREHNTKQAMSAYKAILDDYDADPAIRGFAENRLKTLQG